MVYCDILWYTMVYYGIIWYTMVYCGILVYHVWSCLELLRWAWAWATMSAKLQQKKGSSSCPSILDEGGTFSTCWKVLGCLIIGSLGPVSPWSTFDPSCRTQEKMDPNDRFWGTWAPGSRSLVDSLWPIDHRSWISKKIWLVLWNIFYFPIYWESSSQVTFILFRGVGIPPTSNFRQWLNHAESIRSVKVSTAPPRAMLVSWSSDPTTTCGESVEVLLGNHRQIWDFVHHFKGTSTFFFWI